MRLGTRAELALSAFLTVTALARPASADVSIYGTLTNQDNTKVSGGATGGPTGTNGTIALDRFAVSVSRTYTPTGGNTGTLARADFSPVFLYGTVGPQSPSLIASDTTGSAYRSLVVDFYQQAFGSTPRLAAEWTFKFPAVTSYAPDADDAIGEAYAFGTFAGARYVYYSYDNNGTATGNTGIDFNRVTTTPASSAFIASDPVTVGDVPDFKFITSAAAVPEPASLAMLALGGLAALRRRRRSIVTAAVLATGVALPAGRASAAVANDAFLAVTRADGTVVKGNSLNSGFPDQIEVPDFSFAVTGTGTAATLSPLAAVVASGPQTSVLFGSLFTQVPFKSVVLSLTSPLTSTAPLATYTLSNVFLTGLDYAVDTSSTTFLGEQYTFGAFDSLKYLYNSFDSNARLQGTETVTYTFTPAGLRTTTAITGTVPDFQFVTTLNGLPVAPGAAGPVTSFVNTPEPASLTALGLTGLLLTRRRRPNRA